MKGSWTEKQLEELRRVLLPTEPLGPPAADGLKDLPLAAALLFEPQHEMYESIPRHSGIIIGRRGSGKTAFLDQARRSRGRNETVYLSAPDVFVQILKSTRDVMGASPFVESVADLWEIMIWSCVFATLLDIDHDARAQKVRNYASNIGFDSQTTPEQVIQLVVRFLVAKAAEDKRPIESGMELRSALDFETGPYLAALEAAKGLIASHRKRPTGAAVLVLMDTLEDQRLEDPAARTALSGLVCFVGRQSLLRGMLDVRFCLPAELYETVRELSSNAAKDFHSQVVLQWSAGELWKVAAHRLMIYLSLYHPALQEELLERHNIADRAGAISLFAELLPDEVSNGAGVPEPSLTYILRHTQLLPRHLLQLLNRVLALGMDRETGRWIGVDEAMVLRGVAETEENICRGVASAYKHNYPWIWTFCGAVLPELPRRIADGDLRKVFNRRGKAVIKRLLADGHAIDLEFPAFKRMLIEVGIIGKQIHETDLFWEARFEYNATEELITSVADYFCIHPLFEHKFPSPFNGAVSKLVYPYGSRADLDRATG